MSDFIALLIGKNSRSDYVRTFMARGNMEVMRRMTLVVLVVGVLAFASTYTSAMVWVTRPQDVLFCYRMLFIALVGIDAAFFVLSRSCLSQAPFSCTRSNRCLMLYVVLQVAINLWITVVDFAALGRYFFLLVALFVLFGLYFLPPAYVLLCLGTVYVTMLGSLGQIGLLAPIQIITLSFYLIIIFAVSLSNYVARIEVGRMDERIVNASRHDELTGALNRRAFEDDASALAGQQLYVMLADIDEFKYYNDLYGHSTGDELLIRFSQALCDAFGVGRTYRFGGDEFIVVFPGGTEDQMRKRIDQWRDQFRRNEVRGHELLVTCSAGCVVGHAHKEEDVHDLLRVADVLLYRAKDNGRDQVTYAEYSDGLLREAIVRGSTSDRQQENLDPLTNLVDSTYFASHAAEIAPLLLTKGHSVSFVYCNVANLKDYNAKFGFAEGDELLKLIANVLREVFPGRLLSRFGDDRFVLLTEDEGLPEAIERACAIVREKQGRRLTPLHAGVFRYLSSDVEVRYACDCARLACESLRGTYNVSYRYYTEELGSRMERRNRVLERFGHALEHGYIQPYYQPIIRSVSDLVCEFEILARWVDPHEGVLPPDQFIPDLEEAHLIHQLDLYVVERVCENFHTLMERGFSPCPVSVNFSRLDFEACQLEEAVAAILDRYGIPHGLLRVELTESAFAEDSEHIKRTLDRFRALGMQVWMDDFGSGYSALNVLHEYDFDLVKFDMSFVRKLNAQDPADPSGIMLTNLVNMVKELGLQTLIEGVETVDQLFFLRGIAFEKIQGYVFGKPHSFEELCEKLSNWTYMLEAPEKRAYYDEVGKVNLLQPVEPGSSFDPTGVADGIPVAVLEYADGSIHYLERNMPYDAYLKRKGVSGTLESENLINIPDEPDFKILRKAVAQMECTDEWVAVRDESCERVVGHARCVARVPQNATFAFLYCTM